MPLYIVCNNIIHELSADRCALPVDASGKHDGPCRAVTWREVQELFDEADDGPVKEG